jgi:hypothetical protein
MELLKVKENRECKKMSPEMKNCLFDSSRNEEDGKERQVEI